MTGRVIAGMASGMMLTTVNVYQAEIAPPSLRGTMVSFQIVTLNTAGTLASWVGYGCNFSSNLAFSWFVALVLRSKYYSHFDQALPDRFTMRSGHRPYHWLPLYPFLTSMAWVSRLDDLFLFLVLTMI